MTWQGQAWIRSLSPALHFSRWHTASCGALSPPKTLTAVCAPAEWIDDDERDVLWSRFADGPEPVGYDPAMLDGQGLLLWREQE